MRNDFFVAGVAAAVCRYQLEVERALNLEPEPSLGFYCRARIEPNEFFFANFEFVVLDTFPLLVCLGSC